ncbi:MAG: 4Fe-4S dicluster domain-containing protein [Spirochaetota bacterium]
MPRQRVERIEIDPGWCKGCGICIEFCPKDVIDWNEDGRAYPFRPERCIACELCERMCPDLAVRLVYAAPGDGGAGSGKTAPEGATGAGARHPAGGGARGGGTMARGTMAGGRP